MYYIFKTKLTATTGRVVRKEYSDIEKAKRYFKNHICHTMEVLIYDLDKIVACYKIDNNFIDNVSDEFASENYYYRQCDIKEGYSVSIINNDLLLDTEYFKSHLLADMYYYSVEGSGVHVAFHDAKTIEEDSEKERIIDYPYHDDKVIQEATIIINKYNNRIIEVYFFDKQYNTKENKKKVIDFYNNMTFKIQQKQSYKVYRYGYVKVATEFNNKEKAIEYAQYWANKDRLLYTVKNNDGDIIKECIPPEKFLYYTFNLGDGEFKTIAEALDYAQNNKSTKKKKLYKVVKQFANEPEKYILVKTLN